MSGRPPSRCSTFAVEERMRVPRPAASISMSSGELPACVEGCCCGLSIGSSARGGRGDGPRARLLVAGEYDLRELFGAVPDLLALVEQVGAHDLRLRAELLLEEVVCEPYLSRALRGVGRGLFGADVTVVDYHEVEPDLGRVRLDDLHVLARGVAVGLARLRHQVADENLDRARRAYALGHARDEQVRQYRSVQGAGADRDDVGRAHRRERFGEWEALLGFEVQAAYARF